MHLSDRDGCSGMLPGAGVAVRPTLRNRRVWGLRWKMSGGRELREPAQCSRTLRLRLWGGRSVRREHPRPVAGVCSGVGLPTEQSRRHRRVRGAELYSALCVGLLADVRLLHAVWYRNEAAVRRVHQRIVCRCAVTKGVQTSVVYGVTFTDRTECTSQQPRT